MDIFCEDCLNFDQGKLVPHPYDPPEFYDEQCDAPENMQDSHLESNTIRISRPQIINKENDCHWFVSIDVSSSSSAT